MTHSHHRPRRLAFTLSLLTALLLTLLPFTSADSHDRNPLIRIGTVRDAVIHNPTRRVSSQSTFDLSFDLEGLRIRLALEPNHDLIPAGAQVTYLNADGTVSRVEELRKHDHRVFKGRSRVQMLNGNWVDVGTARVMVLKDGDRPQFRGSFHIYGDSHHIKSSLDYASTKQALDPDFEDDADDQMIIFRDSDIADDYQHSELRRKRGLPKRDSSKITCAAESLEFNKRDQSPPMDDIYKRDQTFWGASSFSKLFARQLDSSPGTGNSAGTNLINSIGKKAGCPTTRKVALVGVASDCSYTGSFASDEDVRKNIIQNMNSASDLFESTFSISLALRNITLMPKDCPGQPQQTTPWNQACSNTVDIQQRLNLFSNWRGEQKDTNSHWSLLTTCKTDTAVGLAWLGQLCVQGSMSATSSDGGNNDEVVAGANVIAKTSTEWQVLAHETGHTFGAVHDCTSQTCADGRSVAAQQCCPLSADTCDAGEQFIMNPSTAAGITQFSLCTVGNICSAISSNVKSFCLSDNVNVKTITGQQCGNGIVEEGEDCDCGGAQGCGDNNCCDPSTCKFKGGAVCDDSNQDCCQDCQLASSTTICRPSTGDCDPAETCTGTDSTCPNDKTLPDGDSCGSSGDGLQCASGQCTSRDLQCKTVMGSYTRGNDTYACDSSSCLLSCGSPEFGANVCHGLQQNFLDGTKCGADGHCENGQCSGNTFGGEVKSWIQDHRTVVIVVGTVIGVLLLISILGCIYRCFKRRKYGPSPAGRKGRGAGYGNNKYPPGYPPAGSRSNMRSGSQRVPSSIIYGNNQGHHQPPGYSPSHSNPNSMTQMAAPPATAWPSGNGNGNGSAGNRASQHLTQQRSHDGSSFGQQQQPPLYPSRSVRYA